MAESKRKRRGEERRGLGYGAEKSGMPNTLLWAAAFCLEAPRIPLSSTYCFPCAISWGDEMAVAEASWVVGWWWWWWWKLVVEWLPSTLVPLVRCNGAGSSGYGDSEGEGKLGSCVILCPACVVDTQHRPLLEGCFISEEPLFYVCGQLTCGYAYMQKCGANACTLRSLRQDVLD